MEVLPESAQWTTRPTFLKSPRAANSALDSQGDYEPQLPLRGHPEPHRCCLPPTEHKSILVVEQACKGFAEWPQSTQLDGDCGKMSSGLLTPGPAARQGPAHIDLHSILHYVGRALNLAASLRVLERLLPADVQVRYTPALISRSKI